MCLIDVYDNLRPEFDELSVTQIMDPLEESNWGTKEPSAPSVNAPTIDEAVYCPECEMWLNGPTQWEDHQIGRKHKKNLRRLLRSYRGPKL